MNRIDKLCDLARYWCDKGNLGYDQSNRYDIRYGGETDCSWLVIWLCQQAGYNTGDASYTGDMLENFVANGWHELPNDGNPKKGYILLNIEHHTALYVGDGLMCQASIDENGNISGGASGDQTDYETNTTPYQNKNWDCYLAPPEYYETENEEGFIMTECVFKCLDNHLGYLEGDYIYWNPSAGFCYLEHPDCIELIKTCNKEIAIVPTASNAPWIERARQATNPNVSRETFGKRD